MKKQEHLTVVGYLKESYYALVDENKKLKQENKALKQENKELHSEMERIGKEARKLDFLVDKLKHAIEAEARN